jgi:thiamine biosynthesis lipoprotein
MFTSGNYARFRQDEQERYPHILDPRSGWPVRGVASATVISKTGTVADAAATALIVAGLDEWMTVARSLGLDQVLIIDDAGRLYLTPEMEARVQLGEGVERTVVAVAATP